MGWSHRLAVNIRVHPRRAQITDPLPRCRSNKSSPYNGVVRSGLVRADSALQELASQIGALSTRLGSGHPSLQALRAREKTPGGQWCSEGVGQSKYGSR
jgi:hypothetical protein